MKASAAPRSGTSAGSGVVITHPDKVLFPDAGITKAEVAAHYGLVAPMLIEHIRGRPVTLERYPQGITAKGFIQKNLGRGTPSWLERVEVPRQDGGLVVYPLVNDARALQWLANQNCITPHVWTSRTPALGQPDLCVFDLDPSVDDPTVLRAAALAVRDLLEELGLPSWVKTSGSKGFHIVVPLDAKADFEDVGRFAYGVASALVARDPDHLTLEFIKVDRAGRIFVDVGRNGFGATFAAPYAVRPLPGAPVSAPCTWDEVVSGTATPQTFTLRSMTARLEEHGDLWAGMSRRRRSLRTATARLRKMLGAAWSEDPRAIQAGQRRTAMREGHTRWLASRRATAT
jgi:bifunctional non-homologous end joining protein LigD